MYYAMRSNNYEAIKLLAGAKVSLDEEDDEGDSPIIYSVRRNNIECVIALARAGADLNKVERHSLKTPLMLALNKRYPHMIRILIDYGASLNQGHESPETALTPCSSRNIARTPSSETFSSNVSRTAIELNALEELIILLENGADISDPDIFGQVMTERTSRL